MRGSRAGGGNGGVTAGSRRRNHAGRLGLGNLGTDRHHLCGQIERNGVEVGLAIQ
jgi:hypothetical protein